MTEFILLSFSKARECSILFLYIMVKKTNAGEEEQIKQDKRQERKKRGIGE